MKEIDQRISHNMVVKEKYQCIYDTHLAKKKNILIIADSKTARSFAICHQNHLQENGLCTSDYIEIAFPDYNTLNEYDEFFCSPWKYAISKEHKFSSFHGVFHIRFELFRSCFELTDSIAFGTLLSFIKSSGSSMTFFLGIQPEFKNIDNLIHILKRNELSFSVIDLR